VCRSQGATCLGEACGAIAVVVPSLKRRQELAASSPIAPPFGEQAVSPLPSSSPCCGMTSSPSRSYRTSPERLWTPPHAGKPHPSTPPPLSSEPPTKPPCPVGAPCARGAHRTNLVVAWPSESRCRTRHVPTAHAFPHAPGLCLATLEPRRWAGPMVVGPSQARPWLREERASMPV
jgi:hypothetical protein